MSQSLSENGMTQRKITWKSEYDVGVPAIDDQHKRLFGLLDNLARPDQEIRHADLILELGRYIADHFAYEEQLMRKHSYPRQVEHVAQHQELAAQYRSMTDGGNATDPKAVARTRMVVYAWFTRHILGDRMDKELGTFLQRIGVFLR
jgi:hemerythrin